MSPMLNLPLWLLGALIGLILLIFIFVLNRSSIAPVAEKGSAAIFYTLRFLLHTLFSVAVVSAVLQIGQIRDVISAEFSHILDYPNLLQDADYLRRTFGETQLSAFRRATIRARLPERSVTDSQIAVFESEVIPSFAGIVRRNLIISRTYEEHWSKTGMLCFRVVEETSVEMIPPGPDGKADLPVFASMDTIAGMDAASLYRLISFKIDGKSVDLSVMMDPEMDGTITFDGRKSRIVSKPEKWEWTAEKYVPLDDQMSAWVSLPTQDVEISLHYPSIPLEPRLLWFAAGQKNPDDARPVGLPPGSRRWKYDGWLLKQHGWLLGWTLEESWTKRQAPHGTGM